MYLQFFLFGSSGLVVLGSVFAGFLACLHSILHPLGSLALTMFVTSLWLVCRASLLSQEQSLLPMLTLVGSGAVCLAHWVAAAMDFLDIFDWVRWKPWSFWLTATMGGKEANRMFGGGLPPPHQLSLRWWWYWQRWVPKKSGFSLLSSVALLLQKGVTLSFVLVLTAAVCSAWFGAEVFPDDPFFSAARNEHFKTLCENAIHVERGAGGAPHHRGHGGGLERTAV
ncbi:hypothetical protein BASA81_010165 [Batrachochytrium salamandrivorans]|nr:hypothetical protein BASA81_010165 [Batrachochytrium salamandrivorans]